MGAGKGKGNKGKSKGKISSLSQAEQDNAAAVNQVRKEWNLARKSGIDQQVTKTFYARSPNSWH